MLEDIPPKNAFTDDKVEWCIGKIMQLDRQLEQLKPRPSKSWYTSGGIWFSIVLSIVVIVLVYIMYLHDIGYTVAVPEWMK